MRSFCVGIAGGSASGKTSLAYALYEALGGERATIISPDYYYKQRDDMPFAQRELINYDHPDSIDFAQMVQQLSELLAGKSILAPQYDYALHNRKKQLLKIEARQIVIVEGILVLAEPRLREMCDLRVFVEADSDLRFDRRSKRDQSERGRSIESINKQWHGSVEPMFKEFVEPSREYAQIIVDGSAALKLGLDAVMTKLSTKLIKE